MKKKVSQECTLPLTTDRAVLPICLGIAFVLAIFMSIAFQQPGEENGIHAWMPYLIVISPMILWEFCRFCAKLHLTREGIAVILFGLTLRRFLAEKIKLLAGVAYIKKGRTRTRTYERTCYAIAVCGTTSVFGAELSHYAGSFGRKIGIRKKDVLLLEFTPDRLNKLRRMYDAPWVDLSEKKELDAQLAAARRKR